MKLVAAAKLRRAQELLLNTRPYAYHMRSMVGVLVRPSDREAHPLLHAAPGDRTCLIVVTSDRGLCGGFNAVVAQETERRIQTSFPGRQVSITLVGRKGMELLRRRKINVLNRHSGASERSSANVSVRIVDEFVSAFLSGQIQEVYCLYSEYKSALSQHVVLEKMLPYEPEESAAGAGPDWIIEPDRDALLMRLLRANLYAQMHRILYESSTSEQGARMAAMDAATENAGDVIAYLSSKYNRARQDAITREVVEIISSAEAL
jgi:F-type H+-transporting ATPase subunit gamma